MCLTSYEKSIITAFYEYSRIPFWIFDKNLNLCSCFFSDMNSSFNDILSSHIKGNVLKNVVHNCEILCWENELYYIFDFYKNGSVYYLSAGPMLLTGFYHFTDVRNLSFAKNMNISDLKSLAEILPVVSLSSFASCLKIMMLLLRKEDINIDEIRNYKFSKLKGALNKTFIHELFENSEAYEIHTPYSEEKAILNCVKDGNVKKLEATYKSLPKTIYGHMSNSHSPLKQLFYGSIANTTLVTRYAIEGGLHEETAFTLSDVYIKKMENSTSLYELNTLNEKMAIDFTERVQKAKSLKKSSYSKPIIKCIDLIMGNVDRKITLNDLAEELNLTPKYLSHLFHKETGETLSTLIEKVKIEKAKNLLAYSDYSYRDISSSLSFYSQSYFISVFKKRVKMTPKSYREKYKED